MTNQKIAHILFLYYSPQSSIIIILSNPLLNTQNQAQNVPQPIKMMKKGLKSKNEAKFIADESKKDKPSSVSTATTGMVRSDE